VVWIDRASLKRRHTTCLNGTQQPLSIYLSSVGHRTVCRSIVPDTLN